MSFPVIFKKSILIVFVFQLIGVMAFSKTEEQKYKAIKSEKDFEIRLYPSATMATVYLSAKSCK